VFVVLPYNDDEPDDDRDVVASKEECLVVRKQISAFHTRLAETAAQRYAERLRIGTTGLLAPPDWLVKDGLIDLADIDGAAAALKAHQATVLVSRMTAGEQLGRRCALPGQGRCGSPRHSWLVTSMLRDRRKPRIDARLPPPPESPSATHERSPSCGSAYAVTSPSNDA
jgi:hypothetical protein